MTTRTFQGEGFVVDSAGMHKLRYIEGDGAATIYGETTILDADELTTGYVVYSNTIGWDGSQLIEDDDKQRILRGVSEALQAWGVAFEIL